MTTPAAYTGPAPAVSAYVPTLTRLTTVSIPAAGSGSASRIATVTDGQWWRIIAGQLSYATSATVANRPFQFIAKDAQSNQLLDVFAPAVMTASQTGTHTFGPLLAGYQVANTASNLYTQFPIPDLLWPGGYQLQMLVVPAGGDAYGTNPAPQFLVEVYVQTQTPATGGALAPPLQLS